MKDLEKGCIKPSVESLLELCKRPHPFKMHIALLLDDPVQIASKAPLENLYCLIVA